MSRKREVPYESDASTDPPDSSSEGGEAIDSDMKRLRVAYNYDGAHGVRWAGEATAMDTNMEIPRARAVRSDYAEANTMLREFHYLRQLRKFQAERGRARANYVADSMKEPTPR
ncbi:uncharacterized protein PITG_12728 [Phytophthora infestans T30-4]|uniref:Uncharacterized protein n=2 Tax=Phytophthora infestans TaxID=4787 RepID=D0NL11_PHYIT|nr:uncharacterized protein PITG_12728 [Phytophthora infestans T30-4]EEY60329.1 conserved hypothetical protein [Phytophthora infestans T30-4]KAF4031720.1 hypothetical protein GN244_ATG16445 [Phytophthora infestans]KAI9983924.1 hypothetical protein PInf_005200 [Phytophthora infestans]|eukprot:XP_002900125.1 conserved hypothetical protein [Phytophthora infestans T30-4]